MLAVSDSVTKTGEALMSNSDRNRSPKEVEQLTSAIRGMASRVNAEFVVDEQKKQNFIAASEQRDLKKSA
jgi:hypothetical protein